MSNADDLARATIDQLLPPPDDYDEAARAWLAEWWADVESRPAEYTAFLAEASNRFAPAHKQAIMAWWQIEMDAMGAPDSALPAQREQAERLFKQLEYTFGGFDFDDLFTLYDYTYPEKSRHKLSEKLHENDSGN